MEDIYLKQLEDFAVKWQEDKVLKLNVSLYGLKTKPTMLE